MNFTMSVGICFDCIEFKEVHGHRNVPDIWSENFRIEKDDQVT